MTENTQPAQPAPHPHANWPQPGQGNYPSHGPYGPTPGNEPPYGPPQPYTPPSYGRQQQYAQPPQTQPQFGQPQQPQQLYGQPQYAPYPPQQFAPPWQQAAAHGKASGFRIAAGIVGMVLGVWFLIPAFLGMANSSSTAFMGLLVLVAALGNVTAGILLVVSQRGRGLGAPVTSLSFAGFALLLGFIGLALPYFGVALFMSALLLATPVVVVMSIGLAKERRRA